MLSEPISLEDAVSSADTHQEKQPATTVPIHDTALRNVLIGCLFLVSLSIAYYFAIALPINNRAHQRFEQKKYEDARQDKAVRNPPLRKLICLTI